MGKSEEFDISYGLYEKKDLYSLIRKNSLYVILERLIVPIINIVITIYIIRKLAITDYGIYNILFALMGYISLFSSFGLPNIFKRYIPEFFERNQISNLRYLVIKGLILRLLFSSILILIVLIFSRQLESLFHLEQGLKYLAIFAIAIIFSLQTNLLNITLTSAFHHKKCFIGQISYAMFRGVVIYTLLKIGKGLVGLLIAESLAFVFLFVIQSFFYKRLISNYPKDEKADFPLKRVIRFGGFDFFNEMGAKVLSKSTDYFVISAFLSPVSVGLYAFADRIMRHISHILPHFFFMNLIQPAFYAKYTQSDDSEILNRAFYFLVKINSFFVIPLFVGIVLLGDKLIFYVFDPKYMQAFPILIVIATFGALDAFLYPIGLVVRSIERVEINLYSKIFAIYNLILDIIVVKPFGIMGVAIVTSTAFLFKNIFSFILTRRHTPLNICWHSLIKVIVNAIIMGITLFLLESYIKNVLSFVLVIITGIIIYSTMSYFNKVFSEQERKIINKILPKPIFIF